MLLLLLFPFSAHLAFDSVNSTFAHFIPFFIFIYCNADSFFYSRLMQFFVCIIYFTRSYFAYVKIFSSFNKQFDFRAVSFVYCYRFAFIFIVLIVVVVSLVVLWVSVWVFLFAFLWLVWSVCISLVNWEIHFISSYLVVVTFFFGKTIHQEMLTKRSTPSTRLSVHILWDFWNFTLFIANALNHRKRK